MAPQLQNTLLMCHCSSMEPWLLSKILPAASLYLGRGKKLNNRHRYKYLYGEEASIAEALWSQRLFFHFTVTSWQLQKQQDSTVKVCYFVSPPQGERCITEKCVCKA